MPAPAPSPVSAVLLAAALSFAPAPALAQLCPAPAIEPQQRVPHSPCPASGDVRFVVVGDPHGSRVFSAPDPLPPGAGIVDPLQALTARVCELEPHFVFFAGDLANAGRFEEWDRFLALTEPLGERRYIVPGNHDLNPVFSGRDGVRAWQDALRGAGRERGRRSAGLRWVDELPAAQVGPPIPIDADGDGRPDETELRRGIDYWFACGASRMLSFSTDSPYHLHGLPDNLGWLRRTLASFQEPASAVRHVFAFTHHPLLYDLDANTGGSTGLWRSLADGPGGLPTRVRALFAGHWHLYQPGRPDPRSELMEIVVGTGGGDFYFDGAVPEQSRFGFLLVRLGDSGIDAEFYADADGRVPYDFQLADAFPIWDPQRSERAPALVSEYRFEGGADGAALELLGSAVVRGAEAAGAERDRGGRLALDGSGAARSRSIGDYDLAILGSLTLSLWARCAADDDCGEGTLLHYGIDMPGFIPMEAENRPYALRLNARRQLELSWERNEGGSDTNHREVRVTSTASVASPGSWHHYHVVRDAEAGETRFYVDAEPLGEPVPLGRDRLPTGGQQGFLVLGAREQPFERTARDPDRLVPRVADGFRGELDDVRIYDGAVNPGG